MKKITGIVAVLFMLSMPLAMNAQDSDVKKAGKSVKKGAKKAGNKTAEVASKGASRVADQRHKTKVGPNGETIYINGESKYYWIDDKGRHQFIDEAKLKDKPKKD